MDGTDSFFLFLHHRIYESTQFTQPLYQPFPFPSILNPSPNLPRILLLHALFDPLLHIPFPFPLCPLVDYQETPEHLSPTLHPQDILIQNSINHGCEVGGIWNRLEWDAMDQYSPSPRTLTCSFSEYKIYPGHGGMYIRKDGQVGVVRVSVITSPCVTWTRSAALWTSRRRDPLAFAGRLLGDVTTRNRR